MSMDRTTAVNRMLRHAGHQRIQTLDDNDERGADANGLLDDVRIAVISSGLEFNRFSHDLLVDANKRVPINRTEYLATLLPHDYFIEKVHPSDGAVYVWDDRTEAWHDKMIADVTVVVDVEWDNIPQLFQQWIAWEAAREYYASHNDGETTRFLQTSWERAKAKALNKLPNKSIHAVTGYRRTQASRLRR